MKVSPWGHEVRTLKGRSILGSESPAAVAAIVQMDVSALHGNNIRETGVGPAMGQVGPPLITFFLTIRIYCRHYI